MADQEKSPSRGYAASRFDEFTLAVFTALLLITITAVLIVGVTTAEDRIGCGLNELVNRLLAYPRMCR